MVAPPPVPRRFPFPGPYLGSFLRAARRRVLLHRRWLAALLMALAAALVVQAAARPPAPTVPVLTARVDLPAGHELGPGDLRRSRYPPGSVPEHAVTEQGTVAGRRLALPLARGEPLSSSRLLGPAALRGLSGRSAVALRLPDAAVASLLHSGDRIDLLATDPRAGPRLVAEDAVVLAVPEEREGTLRDDGRLVLVALEPDQAGPAAVAANAGFVTVVWSSRVDPEPLR